MSVLPPKCHAVLLIHPHAVTARLIPLQALETIAGRHREIVETASRIKQLQLSLNDAPQVPGDSPGASRVSFAKQVDCGLVSE